MISMKSYWMLPILSCLHRHQRFIDDMNCCFWKRPISFHINNCFWGDNFLCELARRQNFTLFIRDSAASCSIASCMGAQTYSCVRCSPLRQKSTSNNWKKVLWVSNRTTRLSSPSWNRSAIACRPGSSCSCATRNRDLHPEKKDSNQDQLQRLASQLKWKTRIPASSNYTGRMGVERWG